jgi:DNA-binding XRE family transcriptional regulator
MRVEAGAMKTSLTRPVVTEGGVVTPPARRLPPKVIRERAGWTVAKMATVAGVTAARVRQYERDPVTALDASERWWLRQLYSRLADVEAPAA